MSLPFYNAHRIEVDMWEYYIVACCWHFDWILPSYSPNSKPECLTLVSAFTPQKARGSQSKIWGKIKIEHAALNCPMKSSILELNWNKQSPPWFSPFECLKRPLLWSIILPKLFPNSIWKLICVCRVWKREDGWKEIVWTFSQIGSFTR